MEYSFRPQWRQKKFYFPSCQRPVCGRCGNVHPNVFCYAFNQKCYRCHRIGHYSRTCFTQMKKAAPKLVDEGPVPSKRKARDRKRLCKYLENKRILRELPFSSLRDNHFRSICDTSCTLRAELKNVKIQLCVSNKENKNMVIKLSKAQCEIEKLENQNMVMKKKMQEQSNNSNDNIFREKIRKLKEDAQADKVLMDLMQRKLNNIGKDYSQYVVKIQEEAEQTAKQLREDNNALLQTIRSLKDERDHLLAVFVENKQQFHPRRHQGRQRKDRFY